LNKLTVIRSLQAALIAGSSLGCIDAVQAGSAAFDSSLGHRATDARSSIVSGGDALFANGFEGVNLIVPSAAVSINTNFQVSWNSIGTTSCDMSGGSSTGWAGAGRATSGTLNLTAPSNAATVAFNISCATVGVPVTDSQNIVFQIPPPASIAINDIAVTEGNSGTSSAVLTVTLTGTVQGGFTVPVSSVNVTATAGSDYIAIAGGTVLSFTGAAGQTRMITVPVIGDTLAESDETFQVLLGTPSAPSVSVVDGTGLVTIVNDDVETCTPTYPNATISLWDTTFNTWPSYGVRRTLIVPANGYRAFEFTATNNGPGPFFGSIALSDYPNDGDGIAVLSISREAGCFNQALLGANCLITPQRFAIIGWINGSSNSSCALTVGQVYFLNFTYGSSTVGPGPHCPAGSGNCGADVTSLIQD